MEDLRLHAVDEHHIWLNGRQFLSLNAVNQMTAANKEEIEWLKKCVNDLPKPARSKWINVEVSYVGDMKHNGVENVASMQCQNCKRYHNEVYFFGQAIEHVNYCPNCGAMMAEEGK